MSQTNEVNVKQLRNALKKFNADLGSYINGEERFKLGRVLTIIDASIADPEQRKAIKDLVNNEWWNSSGLRPYDGPMQNPHTDLRGLALALGFELYEASDLPPSPSGEIHDADKWASEKYKEVLNK